MIGFYLRYLISFVLFGLFLLPAYAQRTCVAGAITTNNGVLNEAEAAAPVAGVIVIPVVVHVLYNNAEENISNEQIRSQLEVLNRDFRKKNEDAAFIPEAFRSVAADAGFEFRLVTTDPSGRATTGIIRKQTHITAFSANDGVKANAAGGSDAWDRNLYLNLWVADLAPGLMGYASTPGCEARVDGVVIDHAVFGTTPNVAAPFHRGRTTVHEIGHWLGLRHIWGDADCGDDRIEDTPPQQGPTRGCPSGVVSSCSSGAEGNMYMNFMDFTNDECTHMFTAGQAAKMRELFAEGGFRHALLSSDKAMGTGLIEDEAIADIEGPKLYPNPVVNMLTIRAGTGEIGRPLRIYSHSGQVLKTVVVNTAVMNVNTTSFRSGVYYVALLGGKTMKFVKAN